MSVPVGVDDLNLYASTLSIDFAEIAAARAIPEKFLRTVGFARRSIVPPYEDPVTLAVNAAKPIVDAASPSDFELLIVATETGIDFAKPISSYVHEYLGLSPTCRNFEIKHACYAGTAAVQMAAAWVRSGVAPGKRALVVMTDIARRHFGEVAELSLGACATALSISEQPRLFELEPVAGYVSQEVYDTARPAADSEYIDPPLSVASYLDCIEMAWMRYQSAVSRLQGGSNGKHPFSFARDIDYMVYHTPFVSLVEEAHRLLLLAEDDALSEDEIAASFEQKVMPGLHYSCEIGNTYSGSMYVALTGLLASVPSLTSKKRIGCFSYGSGSCAEFFSGFATHGAHEQIAARCIDDQLAARRKLTMAEYEQVVLDVEQSLLGNEFAPDRESLPGHYKQHYEGKAMLVLDNVRNHYRSYQWS